MKKVLRIIGKWLMWILIGVLGLLLAIILVFNIFKGKIIDKALDIANEKQAGVVQLENMRLRPLKDFPDVSLQLLELSYGEEKDSLAENEQVPLMRMEDIFVSLDIVQLLRGSYEVNKVRLGKGEINYIVYADSVSNLEKALGISFGNSDKEEEEEVKDDSSAISLNLDDLELKNITLSYRDEPGNIDVFVRLKELNSAFSYLPDLITARLAMNMGIERAVYEEIELDHPRALIFNTALDYDLQEQKVQLGQSTLDIKDAVIDLAGELLLADGLFLDVDFNVKNSGIELLNFLLKGVLDMDAIEQIGSGEIELGGDVVGSFGEELPLITANFRAEDLGFKVKAIKQSVTEINFAGSATNGTSSDLSQAEVSIDHFHATMPDGEIDLSMQFADLVNPRLALRTEGVIDLDIVNNIIDTDAVQGLKGTMHLNGDLDGYIDEAENQFLDRAGRIIAKLEDVSFAVPGYHVEELSGELILAGRDVGFRWADILVNGNQLELDLNIQNLLPNFLGFNTAPAVTLKLGADEVNIGELLSDTALTRKFSEPIRDFSMMMALKTDYDELMETLKSNSIPQLGFTLYNLNVTMPGYSPVTRVSTAINIEEKDILIQDFKGKVGSSSFNLNLDVLNYDAFLEKDSLSPLEVNFELASETMKAKDLLSYKDQFLVLPETYKDEEMENFLFKGKVETKVGELMKNSGLPNFRFSTDDIHWDFKFYPLSFRDFEIDVQHMDDLITVNTFEGRIGESNIKLNAEVENLLDSTEMFSGHLAIQSELLDLNELLNYELMEEADAEDSVQTDPEVVQADSAALTSSDTIKKEMKSLELELIDFPDFQLNVDIGEFRYQENILYGLFGQIRSNPGKIVYLDQFKVMAKTGGTVILDGQFNVNDPEAYTLSSTFDIDSLNVSDFDLAFSMGDSVFVLDETFTGILDAKGIAEIYFFPDMSMDLANSTAAFVLSLKDGRVMNFTPLQAAARFTGSKNLNDVKFGEINNRFTLVDETIFIPLMSINTSLAQLGIEGEQGLDGSFMYLVRIPPALISSTARNVVTGQRKSKGEDEVIGTRSGNYVVLTVSDKGVKPGDKRDDFDSEE